MFTTLPDRSSTNPDPTPEPCRCRFSVRAASDPSVLSRVVELFVLRDLVPRHVACQLIEERSELRIDLEVDGLKPSEAEHVARRMRQFPPVIGVLMQQDGVRETRRRA